MLTTFVSEYGEKNINSTTIYHFIQENRVSERKINFEKRWYFITSFFIAINDLDATKDIGTYKCLIKDTATRSGIVERNFTRIIGKPFSCHGNFSIAVINSFDLLHLQIQMIR